MRWWNWLLIGMMAYGLEIGVSIPPEKSIVKAIGGKKVSVKVILPKGATPVTYSPTLSQIAEIGKVPLFFSIGVPFEKKFIPLLKRNGVTVVDLGELVNRRQVKGIKDPHIWLSPPMLIAEGAVVVRELIKRDPTNRNYYLQNYRKFVERLLELNRVGYTLIGKSFITFHPAYGYFAETYGITQIPIENSEGGSSIALLERIVELGRKQKAKVVFIAPEYPKRFAEKVAQQLGAKVVVVSPLDDPFLTLKKVMEGLK